MSAVSVAEVIAFWFEEIEPKAWWRVDETFDNAVRDRFGETLAAAACGELWRWRDDDAGRLAEIIVLDQFSRNVHRGTPGAFATDPLALALAQEAVRCGAVSRLPDRQAVFALMPYMHSESLLIHDEAVRLFAALGQSAQIDFEQRHRAIIERFGRYPHRNAILGRQSSAEELAYLAEPGAGF